MFRVTVLDLHRIATTVSLSFDDMGEAIACYNAEVRKAYGNLNLIVNIYGPGFERD